VQRKPVWVVKEDFPVWSGTVVTGGDLVFYGSMDGWFKAVNAKTGELAWRYKVDSGIISQPVSLPRSGWTSVHCRIERCGRLVRRRRFRSPLIHVTARPPLAW
jgi:hypothetical protein